MRQTVERAVRKNNGGDRKLLCELLPLGESRNRPINRLPKSDED